MTSFIRFTVSHISVNIHRVFIWTPKMSRGSANLRAPSSKLYRTLESEDKSLKGSRQVT
jgi:hypothetical protein